MFLVFIIAFCAILYPELTGYAFWILVAVLVIAFQEADSTLRTGAGHWPGEVLQVSGSLVLS